MNNMNNKMEASAEIESDAGLTEQPDETVAAAPALPLGPGARMAAQREANGWTIEQVANQLNLAPRQIYALETENFAALPGTASARGFIRSYSRLLHVDPEPMLQLTGATSTASLIEPASIRRVKPTPFFPDSRTSPLGLQGSRSILTKLVAALIVVLALAAGAGYFMGWLPQLPGLLGTATSSAGVTPRTGQPATVAPSETKRADESDSGTSVTSLPAPTMPPRPNLAGAAATAAAVESAAAVAPANKNALVLTFREDSWFELRRGSGNEASNLITSGTAKAGTTESFDVAGPHSITIGNVTGVDASLRGQALDLKSAAKNNVTRLLIK